MEQQFSTLEKERKRTLFGPEFICAIANRYHLFLGTFTQKKVMTTPVVPQIATLLTIQLSF